MVEKPMFTRGSPTYPVGLTRIAYVGNDACFVGIFWGALEFRGVRGGFQKQLILDGPFGVPKHLKFIEAGPQNGC